MEDCDGCRLRQGWKISPAGFSPLNFLMKHCSLLIAFVLQWLTLGLFGDPAAQKVTRTFYVSGLECGGCVYLVQQALSEAKGVAAVELVPSADNYANVTYDPARLSEHQVAQVVREALPLHGTPYLATLRLRFAELERDWPVVDSAMERWRGRVRLEVVDRMKGQVVLHFAALEAGVKQPQDAGWSLPAFRKALEERKVLGRAVKFEVVEEKSPAF